MKKIIVKLTVSFFILSLQCSLAYGLDPMTKIEVRNSYRYFEKCMEQNSNDITECIDKFSKTVRLHKKALKTEPENEKIRDRLLLLVNTLFDIAETYYSAAHKRRDSDRVLAKKYYHKAIICYKKLIDLYPKKTDFREKLKKCEYQKEYLSVEIPILEVANRSIITQYGLLSLRETKRNYALFKKEFGDDANLSNAIENNITKIQEGINQKFTHITDQSGKADLQTIPKLILLSNYQEAIIGLSTEKELSSNIEQIVKAIDNTIRNNINKFKSNFDKAKVLSKKGELLSARKLLGPLMNEISSFSDVLEEGSKNISTLIKKCIDNAIDNFDVKEFSNELEKFNSKLIYAEEEKKKIIAKKKRKEEEKKIIAKKKMKELKVTEIKKKFKDVKYGWSYLKWGMSVDDCRILVKHHGQGPLNKITYDNNILLVMVMTDDTPAMKFRYPDGLEGYEDKYGELYFYKNKLFGRALDSGKGQPMSGYSGDPQKQNTVIQLLKEKYGAGKVVTETWNFRGRQGPIKKYLYEDSTNYVFIKTKGGPYGIYSGLWYYNLKTLQEILDKYNTEKKRRQMKRKNKIEETF